MKFKVEVKLKKILQKNAVISIPNQLALGCKISLCGLDWIAYPDASVNGGVNIMLASAGVHLHDRVVDSGRGLVVPEDVNVFG